jgi:Tfp pilus assembly protein PilF
MATRRVLSFYSLRGCARLLAAVMLLCALSVRLSADKIPLWPTTPQPTGSLAAAIEAVRQGNLKEADVLFQKTLQEHPDTALAVLGRANIAVNQARLADADRMVTSVLKTKPNLPEAHNMKGVVLIFQKKPDEARQEFARAIQLEPKYVTPHLYLATLARATGNQPQTEAAYRELTVVAPRLAAGYLGQAEAQFMQNRPADAMKTLEAWKVADPKSPLPFQVIANVHVANGDPKKALQELGNAVKISPRDAGTLTSLGAAYLATGDISAARTQLATALSIDPSNITASLGLAEISLREGKTGEAVVGFRAVLKLDPSNAVAANNVAWLLAEQGKDLVEALRLAEVAVKRDPNYVDAHDTLGWVRYQRKEFALAIASFKKAVALAPARGDLAAHLGMAYAKAGQKQAALGELQRALAAKTPLTNKAEVEQLVASLGTGR